jgi:copper resistance protein B
MKPHPDCRASALLAAVLLAGPVLAEPLAAPTSADRDSAFPDLGHHAMKGHMDDNAVYWKVLLDELEWQGGNGDDALRWDVDAWAGTDGLRALLRAEGSRVGGDTEENRLELLGWRPLSAWWNGVAGIRHDSAEGPARTYGALGVEGTLPGQLHLEATAYAGERGQTGLAARLAFELLLTNRLILTPRLEAEAWGRDDEATGIGKGFSELKAGLRLRYELRRELAPYAGIEWEGLFGDTADLARADGGDVRDTRLVAGLRIWF